MNRLVITILGIVAAVGGSAIVFVGINKLYDLTEDRYALFNAVAGGLVSAVVFGLVWGNRLVVSPVIVWLIAIVVGAATGYALGLFEHATRRLAVGVAGGAALGLLLGMRATASILPSIDPLAAIVIGPGPTPALLAEQSFAGAVQIHLAVGSISGRTPHGGTPLAP